MAAASFASPPAASHALSMMSSMQPILHAPCSSVNNSCVLGLHAWWVTAETDETWARIAERISALPDGHGREASWLAERLKMKIQRVHNWKTRGVPAFCLVDIAAAIGWSVNQVLGLAEPPSSWPFETIEPERFARLTPRQCAMVELAALHEIERIESSGKQQATGT